LVQTFWGLGKLEKCEGRRKKKTRRGQRCKLQRGKKGEKKAIGGDNQDTLTKKSGKMAHSQYQIGKKRRDGY